MSILNREKYVLIDTEEKEIVWEGKVLVSKESVLQDIEEENLKDCLYRLEIWKSGKKVRNAWVMKKPRRVQTPEELAAKSREDAEAFIAQDAQDIKDRVEAHKAFAVKVKETYGIEGGAVDKIKIPTGKDGNLGILEAVQIATAESAYEGIRENPSETAAAVKSAMNMVPTILASITQLITNWISESNNRKKKPVEKKEELVNKEEPEKKKESIKKKEKPAPKELEVHKEDLGKGVTKTTFGTEETPEPAYQYQKIDVTSTASNTPKPYDLYEQYVKDMIGTTEEVEVEEPERE